MRHLASRGMLAALTAFLAVTAIAGALFVVPTLPPEWLEGSLFTDYTVPAFALACVGGLSLVAFGAVLVRPEVGGGVAVAAGLAIVAFEIVQILVVGLSLVEHGADEPVAWLQVVYIVIGLSIAAMGWSLWRSTMPDRRRLARGASLVTS
jgi:hypothetical protein